MKYVVVAIMDRASAAFGRPAFVPALGSAIRSFSDEVKREAADNEMFKHPDDFDLYHLGAFDDNTGRFELLVDPAILIRGKDC